MTTLTLDDADYAADVGTEPDDQTLAARQACEDLVVTSFMLIDSGQAKKFRELCLADGSQAFDDRDFRGPGLTRLAEDRDADFAAGRNARHTIASMLFRLLSPGSARVRSVGVVYLLSRPGELERRIPLAVIDIDDRLERQPDGRWMIARRQIHFLAGER